MLYTDYIPTDVSCEVMSIAPSSDHQSVDATAEISWYLDDDVMNRVRRFNVSCDCMISNHHFDERVSVSLCCVNCSNYYVFWLVQFHSLLLSEVAMTAILYFCFYTIVFAHH